MQNTIDKSDIEKTFIEIQEAINELNTYLEANKHVLESVLSESNTKQLNVILDTLKTIKIEK